MEYPVLSLSAASIGICEQGVTPFYDIVWSFDYYLENITPETEFGFLFFLQNASVTAIGGTPGPGLGYTQGIDLSRYDRPDEISTFFTPGSVFTYNTNSNSGLEGGLLGVGFDSTGCYALSVTYGGEFIRDGRSDSERIPNSVAIRGSSPLYSYDQYSVNYALTNFNIVDGVKKTVRARLGNLGRTVYIDYRYKPDQDFIPLLTHDIDLGVGLYNYVRPGITITKNISSSNINSAPTIVLENFHFEGKTEIPVLDLGTNLPQLSVLPIGPLLSATPPEDPTPDIGEPPPTPNIETCTPKIIKTVFQDNSIAPNTIVTVDGSRIGVSDSQGIINSTICNGYRVFDGYNNELRGRTDLFIDSTTTIITIRVVPAGNPVPDIVAGPITSPGQTNNCSTTVNIVSAYTAGYDINGNAAPDLYNYGYAISASNFNQILYRREPFKYTNNSNTLTLNLTSINNNWILTDNALNRFIGQILYPIGIFTCGLSTINLSYYNE